MSTMFGRRIERGSPKAGKEEFSFKELKRLFTLAKDFRGIMVVALIIVALSGLMELVAPYLLQFVVDAIFTQKNAELLGLVTLGLIITFFGQSILYFFRSYLLSSTGERIIASLRQRVFGHLQDLPLSFFNKHRTGELVSRLSNDVSTVRSVLTSDLAGALSQAISLIGAVSLIVITNWRLTLFMLALVPVLVVISAIYGQRIRKLSTSVQDKLADSTTVLEESLSNHKIVQSFVREDFEKKRYGESIQATLSLALKKIRTSSIFTPLLSFFGLSAVIGVFWFGGNEVLAGRLTAGQLLMFLVLTFSVAGSLGRLAGVYASLQEATGATKRLFEILDTKPNIEDLPNPTPAFEFKGEIRAQGLSFAYEETRVLDLIDFYIKPGELIAIVGPSGAGKTTLLHLIPRLYEASEGSIAVDGHDIKNLALSSLRSQIGLVPQETFLFGGSVKENIVYGRPDASLEEIIEAAKSAHAHEFIEELPQKYETIIGERGVKLSGGQRQRISIARAILKNPKILLLDEATSSLDNSSEAVVQEALDQLMVGRTNVVVAHRLSTIRNADRILVLDRGKIVEEGTHEVLLERGGLYKNLYDMQFRD